MALVYGIGCLVLIAFLIWRFNRPTPSAVEPVAAPSPVLYFKSNQEAFEYSCKYMGSSSSLGTITPAIVDQLWDNEDDEILELGIFLATEKGPQPATAFVPKELGLQRGDLVGCSVIPRGSRPFVMVDCKLKPVYNAASGVWQIDTAFRGGVS
jgi:hypothetical protein